MEKTNIDKISRVGQVKDVIMFLAIMFLLFKEFRPSPNTITKEVTYIRDTIKVPQVIITPKPVYINRTVLTHDTVVQVVNDTMLVEVGGDTVYVAPGEDFYVDTVYFEGGANMRAMHLTRGQLLKSYYDLKYTRDTIKMVETIHKNPMRFYLTASAGIGQFSPTIEFTTKKILASYGYDMLNHRHTVGVGIKLYEF